MQLPPINQKLRSFSLKTGGRTLTTTLAIALYSAFSFTSQTSAQTPISWNSPPNATNITSTGAPMDGSFRFELGVFSDGFTPTTSNMAEWAVNWHPSHSTFYNPNSKRFAGTHNVDSNASPFTANKPVYVWGFKGSPQEAEWILFRASNWNRPSSSGTPGPGLTPWEAQKASTVVGRINPDYNPRSNPFLMQTEAVTSARPPKTEWATWKELALAGGTGDVDPSGDFDKDGAPNLLEFAMGSDPKKGGGLPATPAQIMKNSSDKFLQMTIPRRIDHQAILTVEVASHPAGPWQSGPTYTTEVSNDINSLIVRDNTPMGPGSPHRFMRLNVALPK
jgi:hypothetical protein